MAAEAMERNSTFSETGEPTKLGVVSGLSARADLNGKVGRAVKWVPKKDRWAVVIVDTGEKVLVRNECLDFSSNLTEATNGNLAVGQPIPSESLPTTELVPAGVAVDSAVVGTQVSAGAEEPPAALKWLMDTCRCFCLPVDPPAIRMAAK